MTPESHSKSGQQNWSSLLVALDCGQSWLVPSPSGFYFWHSPPSLPAWVRDCKMLLALSAKGKEKWKQAWREEQDHLASGSSGIEAELLSPPSPPASSFHWDVEGEGQTDSLNAKLVSDGCFEGGTFTHQILTLFCRLTPSGPRGWEGMRDMWTPLA